MPSPWPVMRWAIREAPTVTMRNGTTDQSAHAVLVALAGYSDTTGRSRPSLATLAADARMSVVTAQEALDRLVEAHLIAKEGAYRGTTVWRLALDRRREGDAKAAAEAKERERRERRAAATRKWRENKARKATTEAECDTREVSTRDTRHLSPVTPTGGHISGSERPCDPPVGVTVTPTTPHRDKSTCHNPSSEGVELPIELPRNYKNQPPRSDGGAPGAPEISHPRTPRGGRKRPPVDTERERLAKELATRYYDAMGRMTKYMAVRGVVIHALKADYPPDVVERALAHMARHERHRPLTRQTLLTAIETVGGTAPASTRRGGNGHQPYRDPDDHSAYFGQIG